MEEELKKQIVVAMKAGDSVRVTTLKLLASSLHNAQIAKMGELTKEEELTIVKKEAKKRKDAIEIYEKAGATDRVAAEKTELAILLEFLPQELGGEELAKLVDETVHEIGTSSISDMGKVIGAVMAKAKGQADGKMVADLVRAKLS